MTLAYLLDVALFNLPCYLLLYLTFRKHLISPAVPRVILGLLFFSLSAFAGSYAYANVFISSPLRALLEIPFIILATCIFCSVANYTFWQGVFIVAVAKSYAENVHMLSLYLYFTASKNLPGGSDLRLTCITFILTLLSFYSIYRLFTKLLLPALDYTITLSTWKVMWIIPICNALIQTLITPPNVRGTPFFLGNVFYFLPPFWTLLTFSTYSILLHMIIKVSQNARLKETLRLQETQLAAQQKQLETMQLHAEAVRRIKHDTRHHMLALKGLLKNRNHKEIEQYLQELTEGLPSMPESFCDNPSINALLCNYSEQARQARIHVDFSASIPEKIPFSDTDLCIILGNFLENAIEACRRMQSPERFIKLKISMPSSRTLVILAENSYEGTIQRAKDGSFLSSKEKDRKGLGISSVLNVTEKYNGIPRFEYQGTLFKASLLLNSTMSA